MGYLTSMVLTRWAAASFEAKTQTPDRGARSQKLRSPFFPEMRSQALTPYAFHYGFSIENIIPFTQTLSQYCRGAFTGGRICPNGADVA